MVFVLPIYWPWLLSYLLTDEVGCPTCWLIMVFVLPSDWPWLSSYLLTKYYCCPTCLLIMVLSYLLTGHGCCSTWWLTLFFCPTWSLTKIIVLPADEPWSLFLSCLLTGHVFCPTCWLAMAIFLPATRLSLTLNPLIDYGYCTTCKGGIFIVLSTLRHCPFSTCWLTVVIVQPGNISRLFFHSLIKSDISSISPIWYYNCIRTVFNHINQRAHSNNKLTNFPK